MTRPSLIVAALALGLMFSGCQVVMAAAQTPDSPAVAARHGKPQHLETEPVTVYAAKGPVRFSLQVADDEPEREVGLMFVKKMGDREGMIFDFPDAGEQAFWMHGTRIGLDIIYVAPDGRILSIAKRAKPFDETPLPSRGSSRAVIEINAGLSDRLGLAPGDKVCDAKIFHCK